MSTIILPKPVTKLSDLDPEGSYTYADYMLWQFQERVELIRGRLFRMSPAPNLMHQRISQGLNRCLLNFFYQKPCQVFAAPFDVRLSVGSKRGKDSTVVQPDLCVVCDESKLDEQGCAGAPDLVVEILSPGNSGKEMKEKFRVYEEAGVREYWIVNPAEHLALVYILHAEGRYIGLAPVTEEDPLRSHIFPELVIDLKEVFA
ncbi:MAG: Uma2 family endonuclease [Saprospiraceae bacterium]|nr:Uma2 family endonuclease [Saprospiraceae bacterium]